MITYRVIREGLNQRFEYDFDDKEDAAAWIMQELGFDEDGIFHYSIVEVDNDIG